MFQSLYQGMLYHKCMVWSTCVFANVFINLSHYEFFQQAQCMYESRYMLIITIREESKTYAGGRRALILDHPAPSAHVSDSSLTFIKISGIKAHHLYQSHSLHYQPHHLRQSYLWFSPKYGVGNHNLFYLGSSVFKHANASRGTRITI